MKKPDRLNEELQDDARDLCIDLVLDYADLVSRRQELENEKVDQLADDLLAVLTESLGI